MSRSIAVISWTLFWTSATLIAVACSTQSPAKTTSSTGYDRYSWGRWADVDEDCQDTRQEVLIRQSEVPVTLDDRGCRVLVGRWTCPYTGQIFTDPGLLDIDHTVPLKEAYDSGAATWNEREKSLYFNYSGKGHLVAVDRSANRSKGSRQPHEWLPPNEAYRCQYIKNWLNVKRQWELEIDCVESQWLATAVSQFCF